MSYERILKLSAVIELLSTLNADHVFGLGLEHLEYELQEVFDDALDEWEVLAGFPHPLDLEDTL